MCDLNWCTVCDKAISCDSNSLYCSNECFSKDAKSYQGGQDFQLMLTPKTNYRSFNSKKELPELSIYSTSTVSTTSTLSTNRFITTKSLAEPNESCCDYCQNANKNHSFTKNNFGPFDFPTLYDNLEYRG
ncbi:hypothetical protein BD770DRAFT_385177 [Pilaira anomala]|nr:hypothetical protein BD770DRAFT_385177 [Pilaira anomala]